MGIGSSRTSRRAAAVTMAAAVATAAGLFGAGSAHAQVDTNSANSGSWHDASTWTNGVPRSSNASGAAPTNAFISDNHLVTINDLANTLRLDLGDTSGETGSLSLIAGGDLLVDNTDGLGTTQAPVLSAIRVGLVAGSTGNVTNSGGAVFVSGNVGSGFGFGDILVGDNGTGNWTQTSGSTAAADEIIIGTGPGSVGVVDLDGGTFNANGRSILVGFSGNGTLDVSGTASVRANFDMLVGLRPGSTATINQSGGTIEAGVLFTNNVFEGAGSTVNMTQTGGTYNARIAYVLGQGRGSTTMTHSGGAINVPGGNGDMVVGDGGLNTTSYTISNTATVSVVDQFIVGAFGGANGTVTQNGGSITANGGVLVGRNGVGTWNMNGGTLTQTGTTTNGDASINNFIVGRVSNSSFNQTGGTVNVARNVFLGDFDNATGTYRISGGALNVTGNLNVGAALASNAPAVPTGTQGQALDVEGIFVVTGPGGDINVSGRLLANPGDHTRRRADGTGDNISRLIFEVLAGGVSRIDVGGIADLTGASIDVDILGGSFAEGTKFDLITATDISEDYTLASEDAGAYTLAVVPGGNGEILQATVVPEPATLSLLALAGLGLCGRRRRA